MHVLHLMAVKLAKTWQLTEVQLLDVIQKIDEVRGYREMGYASLHAYIVGALGLSDANAATFSRVARKSVAIPELKEAVVQGEISIHTAKKIIPVITQENKAEWLTKAKEMPQKKLEREVAALNPELAIRERIKPVCEKRSELRCGLSPELEAQLKRIQDLESSRLKKHCTLEEALKAMAALYLEKKDPVKKAERVVARPKRRATSPLVPKGRRIPMPIKNQVMLRDKGQCRAIEPTGKRCEQRRWIDIHHVKPVSLGGTNQLANLITLCKGHHQLQHMT